MNAKKIKQIQSLKHQKYRKKYRQFFIEGKRLVKSAIESETTTLSIIYTNVFYESNELWLKSINNSYVEQVSSNVFQKLVSNTKIGGEEIQDKKMGEKSTFLFKIH